MALNEIIEFLGIADRQTNAAMRGWTAQFAGLVGAMDGGSVLPDHGEVWQAHAPFVRVKLLALRKWRIETRLCAPSPFAGRYGPGVFSFAINKHIHALLGEIDRCFQRCC